MKSNENDTLERRELIEKMEEISALYANTLAIKREMNSFEPEDNYEREIIVPTFPGEYEDEEEREEWEESVCHEEEDAIEQMKRIYDERFCPPKPVAPEFGKCQETVDIETAKVKRHSEYVGIAIVIGILFFFFFLLQMPGTKIFSFLVIAVCVGFVISYYVRLSKAKEKDLALLKEIQRQYAQEVETKKTQYDAELKEYERAYTSHELECKGFLDEYSAWREIYIQHLQEEESIDKKLENDRVEGVNKIYEEKYTPAKVKLDECNNLLAEEYLPAIDIIIDLLKSGRADNLKESINLYEEILYKERQLQLQREQEEQRRYEEEIRRQDEERRYQEEMAFRNQQERNRQREAERRERDAERRHKEELELREKQERDRQYEERRRDVEERRRQDKAELEQKRKEDEATRRQCNTCALTARCSMAFRRPNCASYRPR